MLRNIILCMLLCCLQVLQAQTPRLVLPVGHTLGVFCTDFSGDGRYIVTGGKDNNAIVWEAASGKLLHVLRGHTQLISSVQFSPDGKQILTASYDGLAAVWDFYTGKNMAVLRPSSEPDPYNANIMRVANYSADGKYIVTTNSIGGAVVWDAVSFKLLYRIDTKYTLATIPVLSKDGKQLFVPDGPNVSVMDVATGKILNTLAGHKINITALSVSRDGTLLLSASGNDIVSIWDINTSKQKTSWPITEQVYTAEISPDNSLVFLSGAARHQSSGNYSMWDMKTRQPLYRGTLETNNLKTHHFSPDGRFFITSPNNAVTQLHEPRSGKILSSVVADAEFGYVECAQFSDNGKYLLTAGYDRAGHLWDLASNAEISTLAGHTLYTNTLEFSKDGKYYVTASDDATARIVDATTGAAVTALKGHQKEIMYSQFSPDGNLVLTVSRDATARIWDKTGNTLQVLKGHKALIFRGEFSPDGTKAVTASNDSTAKVWEVTSGKLLFDLRGHKDQVWNAHFNNDGTKIATASKDGTAIIWNAQTGMKLFELDYKEGLVSDAIFSSDGSKVLLVGEFNIPVLYDANTGKGILILDGHRQHVYAAAFSHNGKYVVTGARDGTAGIWSTETLSFIKELKGHTNQINSVAFTKDDKRILTSSEDRTAIVWSAESGNPISVLKGHTGFIRTAVISPDAKSALTVSEDNTIKQWSLQHNNLEYTRVELDAADYLVYAPTGYYSSSPDAAKKLHYVTSDLQVITFDQLDIRYNRPDMVLSTFDTKDTSLILSYNKAWQKRVKKLGVDTMQFSGAYSAPVADIVNRDAIGFEQTTDQLSLRISASDSVGFLQRYNIWVNDVPVFGLKGKPIDNKHQFSTTNAVTLSSGVNRIEVSAINNNGTESLRTPLLVKYTPSNPVAEKVYFIGIGINQYANSSYNLTWSVKDIRDMAMTLRKHYGNSITIDTLFDQQVTKENILALKNKLLSLTENDKVIVSFSGHGVLSKDLDYFLSTYHISFEQPGQFGLPYDDLESLMDGIRPRKKLMLIDACHSGEVDKEEFGRIESGKADLGAKGVTARSSIKVTPKKTLGMTNSFELMQQLFSNVRRGTGATIISAAGGMQYAQERGELKNGVFTYSILDAFKTNKTLTVSQLKKIVAERVTSLTNGLQKPTSRNETINVDWEVW